MTHESVKQIPLEAYLQQRTDCMDTTEQSLFDFMYCTGTRITEALKVKGNDIDRQTLTVNILTEKNPREPYRNVAFYPQETILLNSILNHHATRKPNQRLWNMTRQRAWKLSKRYFHVTDHSFRHTNAIACAMPPVAMNAPELCARFGWSKWESAKSYLNYDHNATSAKKMNLKTPSELGLIIPTESVPVQPAQAET